jgi:hypothetical protein
VADFELTRHDAVGRGHNIKTIRAQRSRPDNLTVAEFDAAMMHSLSETLLKFILPGVIDCLPLFPLRFSLIDAAENEGFSACWAWQKVATVELITITTSLGAHLFGHLTFGSIQRILNH